MTDEHEEKTVRLLNIIDQIVLSDAYAHHLDPPFTVNDDGVVKLSSILHEELSKPENEDLLGWAQQNLVNLFE